MHASTALPRPGTTNPAADPATGQKADTPTRLMRVTSAAKISNGPQVIAPGFTHRDDNGWHTMSRVAPIADLALVAGEGACRSVAPRFFFLELEGKNLAVPIVDRRGLLVLV